MNLNSIAKTYIERGFSVIPLDDNKRPLLVWTDYTKKIMSIEDVDLNFKHAKGIGLVCGKVSGGVEVIDWDLKYSLNPKMYETALEMLPAIIKEKLLITSTRNGGYHWIYRCNEIDGNKKLAQRLALPEEQDGNPHDKIRVLTETRGEKGFICTIGTDGYKHVSGKGVSTITPEERTIILDIAASFNEVYNVSELFLKTNEEKSRQFIKSPFDDYNERESALTIILSHGWTTIGSQNGSKVRVLRPNGKSDHSGFYSSDNNRLYVFSTSTIFDAGKAYSPSELYTILYCNNDWKKSYKELLEKGYGEAIDKSSQITAYINLLKSSNMVEMLKDKFGGNIINSTIIEVDGKKYKI